MPLGTVISQYLGSHCTEKERNRGLDEIFSSSDNAVSSILLKYQEIDVQIQAFTEKN